MGNDAWSKIQLHGNLELKNMMVIYTLTLRANLGCFLESILYILYIVSKLGKSGVQRFKRCMIWSWNKKFMAVWRRTRKAEWEFRIQDAIWKGVSQLRNHPLEHECHFVAPYVHFTTAKWAAKIPLLREILPPLQKWPPSFKMATKMLQASKWVAKFPFGWEMFSQPHSYPLWNYPWAAKNVFLYSLWLQDDLQAAKWPPSYKNDLQHEERFAKTLCKAKGSCENANKAPHHAYEEESPLTEITHMKPLIPFLTSLNHQRP